MKVSSVYKNKNDYRYLYCIEILKQNDEVFFRTILNFHLYLDQVPV